MLPIALASLVSLASVGVAAPAKEVLARGKDVEVTQAQLDEAFINLRATLAAQGRTIPEPQREMMERQLTEKLALTQLLLGKATAKDRAVATEKVQKLIREQKSRARSDALFEAQIRAAGLSPDTFEKQLLERAICEEVLDRELRPLLKVTPETVRGYFDQHSEEFRQPERIRLRQVVLSTRQPSGAELSDPEKMEKRILAQRLLERLQKGEEIQKIAREYSDDPAGRDRDGEYVFPIGRIVPELESAILALPTNKLSQVIATPYGYHIVKVLERLSGDVVAFDQVAPRITQRLELEATEAILPDYQKKLFGEAGVEFTRRDSP
jgi:parvulin-like peptidyl-prolyl isomerase